MSRTLIIARREYLAYVRTVGFWLSLLALPLLAVGSGFFVAMMEGSQEPRMVAVSDLTGEAAAARDTFVRALEESEAIAVRPSPEALATATDAASADAAARGLVTDEGPLDAVVILTQEIGLVLAVDLRRRGDEHLAAVLVTLLEHDLRAADVRREGFEWPADDEFDADGSGEVQHDVDAAHGVIDECLVED